MIASRRIAARCLAAVMALGAALLAPLPSQAALTLNATGLSLGFSLSVFATGSTPGEHYGAAALSDGTVVTTWVGGQQLLKYPDIDGQSHATALATQSLTGVRNVTRVNGVTYAMGTSGFYSLDNSLNATPLSVTGLTPTWGLAANPVTGHLLAGTTTGIWDIDPLTGTKQFVTAPFALDGIAVSADGQVVYAAIEDLGNPRVVGYLIAGGAQQGSTPVAGVPHGVLVVREGPLAGRVVITNHDGTLGIMNADGTGYQTIATGGTPGRLGAPDLNDGSAFLSFDDQMYRLSLDNGNFGIEPAPEPASLVALLAGLGGMAAIRRRRKAD